MEVVRTREDLRALTDAVRTQGSKVGFVPTMGALHPGHASLLHRARVECDLVVCSIFVNPLQFNDPKDLERYPRPLANDLALAEAEGCDVVFHPEATEMYPDFPRMPETRVTVAGPSVGFEGGDRPGHFDGVATVVAVLFEAVGPCAAYFGEKDFQQLAVVSTMVRDLGMPIEIVGCPTHREDDGLARSSRNVRLSPEGRLAAVVLSHALNAGAEAVARGASVAESEAVMQAIVAAEPAATLFYAAVVDPHRLEHPTSVQPGDSLRLLIAAEIEGVRLIDNCAAVVGTRP